MKSLNAGSLTLLMTVLAILLLQSTKSRAENFADDNIHESLPPVRVFAEALAARGHATSEELKLSAEYWISQSLFASGLNHIAYAGFSKMAAVAATSDESARLQGAAIQGLNQIHARYPSFVLPKAVFLQVPRLLKSGADIKKILWEFAFNLLLENASPKVQKEALELLEGAGAYEHLARGILASQASEHAVAIIQLNLFLTGLSSSTPLSTPLNHYEDHARLLLSRSYYSTGAYDLATQELGKIKKSSNDLAEILNETAWAHLMNEKYGEAIGTALSLRAGGLRHTFSPEAPMVMAMALNELCQFPESISAIQQFKKDYEKSFHWLSSHPAVSNLYSEAIHFLRRKGEVPDRIGTEWVRSPIFISHQEEINLLFQERQASLNLGKTGAIEQKKLGLHLRDLVQELKHLSPHPIEKIRALKDEINHYKRLQSAAATWHRILKTHNERVPGLNHLLVNKINQDLRNRTERMFAKLEDIAENNQLIEVEIYNGASQDMIWQNAHPEYKEIARKIHRDQKSESADKVWDWGNSKLSEEIWEDELGSFKAKLFNNCSKKPRT